VTKLFPIEPASGHGTRTGAREVFWFLAAVAVLSGCVGSGTRDDTVWSRGASGAGDASMGRSNEAYHRIMPRDADSITPSPALAVFLQGCFDCRIAPREEILRPTFAAAVGDAFHAVPRNPGDEMNWLSGLEATTVPRPAMAPESFPLYFALDSNRITAAGQRSIDAAVTAARKIGATDFAVTGHTGPMGSDAHTMKPLLRRAKAVSAALVARGISPARISIANQIEVEPTVATVADLGELSGRRVDIILLEQY
jgi:outer membrane protein OmpA-like peptidoglycan-associated protein